MLRGRLLSRHEHATIAERTIPRRALLPSPVSILRESMKHDEFDFQCLVVSALEHAGVPVFSVPNHLMRNGLAELRREMKAGFRKGAPDLIAGKDGKSYWLELKTPVGKQSAEQVAFSSVARLFGAEYRVVRTLDDIKDLCDG